MATPTTTVRPVALVTGGSSGIGRELARLLAADGHDVVLVARDQAALEAVAAELRAHGGTCRVLPADLADPASPQRIAETLAAEGVVLDVLVNNAGFGDLGRFTEIDAGRQAAMIQVNVVALTHLTRLFIPGMVARRRGRILNVASVAAFQPIPHFSVYAATKAYVLSFSEALAEEVAASGVTVTALCPGPTATNFSAQANAAHSSMFTPSLVMDARTVARLGYRALTAGRRVRVTGAANTLLSLAPRLLPRRWVARIAGHFVAPRGKWRKTATPPAR